MSAIDRPYPYPVTNSDLIRLHSLQKHFEAGYFAQTVSLESTTSATPSGLRLAALGRKGRSAWGPATVLTGGKEDGTPGKDVDATVIYYLLTPDSYRGKMHMNLHSHIHLHHSGRALYTLIEPPQSKHEKPTIHRIILGPDITRGEVSQLFVPGGWWKVSEIPEEDRLLLDAPDSGKELKERIGCLISEVVIPGWNPDQHVLIDEEKLKEMWGGQEGWEVYGKYLTSGP